MLIEIQKVKKGDFIRRKPEAKKTYQYAGWCNECKGYQIDDCDDISRCMYLKKNTLVDVGFTY